VLRSFLDGYEQLGADRPFEVAAVTGPLMSPRKRRRFQQRVRGMEGVTLVEFTDTLPDLLEAADFAVTMGGYNTVCELACAGARALIVPRSFPREEQLVRAKLLTERGVVAYLNNPQPGPRELMEHVLKGIEAPRPRRGWGLRFSGLDCAVDALEQLVGANGPPGTTRDSRSREHRSKLRSPNRTQHDGR
jgi:predicted glycosyltransferase